MLVLKRLTFGRAERGETHEKQTAMQHLTIHAIWDFSGSPEKGQIPAL